MPPILRTHIKSAFSSGAICGARTVGPMGITIRLEFVDAEPSCKRCVAAIAMREKARELFRSVA